jgi:membrane-associated phospholipid phosphatase
MGRGRTAVVTPRWLSLALLTGCVAVFAGLSLDVTHDGAVARLDLRLAPWMARNVTGGLHDWAWRLTHLGDAWLLALVVAVLVAMLLLRRRWPDAALLVVAGAATALVTTIAKDGFRRSRPPFIDPSHQFHSFSYPSGHASGAFAVYVLAAVLLTRGRSTRTRVGAVACGLVVATLVATTRVVLPVHYLSDVVAGAAVGLAIATGALLVRGLVARP